jgi:hypothetical protein
MTLLQKMFVNANLPTDIGGINAYHADLWWRAEMRVLRKYWIRSGWAV